MNSDLYKYPRTPHLPWSPGGTDDDKTLSDVDHFKAMTRLIITEKMDGENTTMYPDHIHARSLDSKHHASRDWVKGMWSSIKHEIPTGWRICGENLYAKHSIEYEVLKSYFYVFSIWDENNKCLSWEETREYCSILGLELVPVLYEGSWDDSLIKNLHNQIDLNKQEGFVIRNAESFSYEDFGNNIGKWVRKGHVQTDKHWMFEKIVPNGLKKE